MVSDVPVANFLSGGLDSTSIVKNMYENGVEDINTFTVAVNDINYDESKWAKTVSEKYNTLHNVEKTGEYLLKHWLLLCKYHESTD